MMRYMKGTLKPKQQLFCYTTSEMLLFSADESRKLQTPAGPNIIM